MVMLHDVRLFVGVFSIFWLLFLIATFTLEAPFKAEQDALVLHKIDNDTHMHARLDYLMEKYRHDFTEIDRILRRDNPKVAVVEKADENGVFYQYSLPYRRGFKHAYQLFNVRLMEKNNRVFYYNAHIRNTTFNG